MAVALDHLGADVGACDSELFAYEVLHEWRDVGEIAHYPADLAYLYAFGGLLEAGEVALHLSSPKHPFQPERCDVGMDAVGAAYAGLLFVFLCLLAEHLDIFLYVFEKNFVGLLEEVAVGGVYNVGGGQPVVHPLALVAKRFADRARECHHVVACLKLYLLNAVDVEGGFLVELLDVLAGHDAEFTPGFGCEKLYLKICAELVFLSPTSRITSLPYLSIISI